MDGQESSKQSWPRLATLGQLHDALKAAGVILDGETFIFIDESDQNEEGPHARRVEGLKHGCRVHVTRCKRIKTTVHYLDQTAEREFAPGARVRRG